jgi:hypothetical protein
MTDWLCATCRFWGQVRPEGPGVPGIPGVAAQGECKRYAPHPSVGSGHRHVLWPLTAAPITAASGCRGRLDGRQDDPVPAPAPEGRSDSAHKVPIRTSAGS